jgi:hypothetical protein
LVLVDEIVFETYEISLSEPLKCSATLSLMAVYVTYVGSLIGSEHSIPDGSSCMLCISASVEMSKTGNCDVVSPLQKEVLVKVLN